MLARIFAISLLLSSFIAVSFAQQKECLFGNEDCDKNQKPTPLPIETIRTDAEHIERCVSDYARKQGGFAAEGRSTSCMNGRKCVKSRSDAIANCKFAVSQKNYYWDHPAMTDDKANFNCCVKYLKYYNRDKGKYCRDYLSLMKNSRIMTYDWCLILQKYPVN